MNPTDRHRLYGVWTGMNARCDDPLHRAYPWYGARGITVEFQGFKQFANWAEESGYAVGLWIDRIDSDGNYSPTNCRWVTPSRQQRNRRSNRMLTIYGETKCMADWADDPRCQVSVDVFRQRVKAGTWDLVEALTKPLRNQRTHCDRGHPYDERRLCLQCYNEGRRERRHRARLANARSE